MFAKTALLCVALLTVASATSEVPESEWEGWSGMSPDIEMIMDEAQVSADAQLAMDMAKGSKVLANLRMLKAFSITVYDQALSAMKEHSSMKHSALCKFLVAYGKVKKKNTNIVSGYGKAMGAVRKHYPKGLNAYLLKHLDKATVFGHGAISTQKFTQGTFVAPAFYSLGFKSRPHYFKKLEVRLSAFTTIKMKVDETSKNADSLAAAAWLAKGAKKAYKSFLDKVVDAWNAKEKQHTAAVARHAVGAIDKAFRKAQKSGAKKQGLVVPQPPAGVKASKAAEKKSNFKMPKISTLKKEAAAAAKKWTKKVKKKVGTKGVVESIEGFHGGDTTSHMKAWDEHFSPAAIARKEKAKKEKADKVEKAKKEKKKKELHKKEKAKKEKEAKAEKALKEKQKKEKAAKKKEKADKAAKKKEKAAKDEKKAKEKTKKVKAAKEKAEKAEKADKESKKKVAAEKKEKEKAKAERKRKHEAALEGLAKAQEKAKKEKDSKAAVAAAKSAAAEKAKKAVDKAEKASKKEEEKKQKALKAAKAAAAAAKAAAKAKSAELKKKADKAAAIAKRKAEAEAERRKKVEEVTHKAAEKSTKAAKEASKKESDKKAAAAAAAREVASKAATKAAAEKATKAAETKAKAAAREAKEKAYCKVAVYNDNNFHGMTWSKQICKSGERYNLTYNQKKKQHSVSLQGPGCSWMRLGDDDSWGRQDVTVRPPGIKNLPYDLESDIKDIQVYLKNDGMKGC
jgi:hypothetical protein